MENDLVKLSVIESEVSMKCDIMSVLWSSGVLRNREETGVDEDDGHFLTAGFGFEFGGKSWPQPLILKEKKCCF